MKRFFYLCCLCIAFFLPVTSLRAQTASVDQQAIELTPDELKAMIRKMAELRRQRVMMWQLRQEMMRQRAASQEPSAQTNATEARTVIREDGRGSVDTIVRVEETMRPEYKITGTADNGPELASINRRLDRQEALLMDLRERSLAAAPSAPARTDTIIQQIMLNQRDGQGANLSKEDLRALTTEVSRMNAELNGLRRRLADEEDRRRRAELETDRIRRRNAESESWESERLRYERDLNRILREEERMRPTTPVAPVVIGQEGPVRIVRDTVYVDRVSTTPVFIPTTPKTDTVTIIKETIREVPAEPVVRTETVIRDREVVKTDTLQLKATEPISFPAIFFDNNSSQLNAAHRNLIASAVEQLKGKTNYTIRLTGFASPSGNTAYNQQLSAKRADAVRQGFENQGMNGDRIVIVPGGIDFQPTNAAAARRVEVQALPR